jgi:protein TonB
VLWWVAWKPPEPFAGADDQVPTAVNVTVVSSAVLESRDRQPAPATPATVNTVEAKDGTLESAPRPKSAEQKEEPPEAKEAPRETVPDEALAKAPSKTEVPPEKEDKERKEASLAAQPVGGASARGEAPTTTKQSAPAAASPGAIRRYARAVQQALAARRPKASGRGTVVIRFAVSTSGEVAAAEVLKSSGSKRLDDVALAEVRRAKLPIPPPGLSDDERLFDFPFYFGGG